MCVNHGLVGCVRLASPTITKIHGGPRGLRGLVFRGDRSGEIPMRERARVGTFILPSKQARRPYEGGIVCGDVVAYGWIDSVLEFKKQKNTRAHGRACEHACERVVRAYV